MNPSSNGLRCFFGNARAPVNFNINPNNEFKVGKMSQIWVPIGTLPFVIVGEVFNRVIKNEMRKGKILGVQILICNKQHISYNTPMIIHSLQGGTIH